MARNAPQLGTCHVITIKSKDKITDVEYAAEIETLWLDYVLELASEARAEPAREATAVVNGIHPFVMGTPD